MTSDKVKNRFRNLRILASGDSSFLIFGHRSEITPTKKQIISIGIISTLILTLKRFDRPAIKNINLNVLRRKMLTGGEITTKY